MDSSKALIPIRNKSLAVHFQLKCDRTRVGDIIKVTGSCTELGNWIPIQGVSMLTTPKDFPIWAGHVLIQKEVTSLEYKYVIVRECDGQAKEWEPIIGNHQLDLANVREATVEDSFGAKTHTREIYQQWGKEVEESKVGPFQMAQATPTEQILSSGTTSPKSNYKKQVGAHKIREVTNIVDKYHKLTRKTVRMHHSSNEVERAFQSVFASGMLTQQNPFEDPQSELSILKERMSTAANRNVDEEDKTLRSIDEVQQQRKSIKQQHLLARSHTHKLPEDIYDFRNESYTDEKDLFQSLEQREQQVSLSLFPQKHSPHVTPHQNQGAGGTTGGVISSGEDDDEENDDDEDEDLVGDDKRLLEDVKITADDIVIVASFKLPITVYKDSQGAWKVRSSRSLLYPTLFKLREKKKMVKIFWIGWPGVIPQSKKEEREITELLRQYNCVPAFFDAQTIERFLYFHETVLRPLFHNFKGLNDCEDDLGSLQNWEKYQEVNYKFAMIIIELNEDREMVWIHDNYLLLVPTYVRKRDKNANIGFFMHCPFPSSDIYKMFPYRSEILRSLLLCDLIGFHLFEYARNFYTTCRRILGLNHEFKKGGFLSIECFGRQVMIRISHIGIQEEDIMAAMETDIYKQFGRQLQQQLLSPPGGRKHIISSVDRFHPISGLKNKLLAYQKFLTQYPSITPFVCLVQYVQPTEGHHKESKDYIQTHTEINTLVREIQDAFGKAVIHYCEEDLLMEQRIALWAVTNVLLITTLRDGQCLPPLEYITVKKLLQRTSKSAVILSEFSGCNRALGGVLKINPFNVDEITKNIDLAVNMPQEEREQRMKIAYNYISKHSTLKWAESFLKDLKRSHQPCEGGTKVGRSSLGSVERDVGLNSKYIILGLGLNLTLIKTQQGCQEIQVNYVQQNYQSSINRLIIIDQDDVLPMKGNNRGAVEPMPHVLHYLNELSKDERNTVLVISSNTKDLMHKWYAQSCPKLGLAAENGFFWRIKSEGKNEHQWIKLLKVTDFCWIESVKDIMQSYTEKTDGVFIEEKESMIVWNYRDTDPEFGNWQAKELTSHLEHVFCNLPIKVVQAKKSLEVVPSQHKKQKLVKYLVESIAKKFPIDFIMYVGEDNGNEPVFTYLNNKKQQSSKFLTGNASIYTCTMGRRATQAKYFLNDTDQVVNLLESLSNFSHKITKRMSQNKLRNNQGSANIVHSPFRSSSYTLIEQQQQQRLEEQNSKSHDFVSKNRNSYVMQKTANSGMFLQKGVRDKIEGEEQSDEISFTSGNSSSLQDFNIQNAILRKLSRGENQYQDQE